MKTSFILLATVLALHSSAQSDLNKNLIDNRSYVEYKDGRYYGAGWEIILRNGIASKYFLLGEDHGTKEIPEFARAIASSIKFEKAVIEVDPFTAAEIERAAKLQSAEREKWLQKHSSELAFYSAADEFSWVNQLVQGGAHIWGLDQVSVFSDRLLLEMLRDKARTETAKKAAANALQMAIEGFSEFNQSGNGGAVFMFKSDSIVFANLRKAFASEGAECLAIINDMALSSTIYQNWKKGSHAQRVKLMKHNLKTYFDKDQDGKMFFKLGAVHLSKGESLMNIFDIGNMIDNYADAGYSNAFALMVVGAKGNANTFVSVEGGETHPIDILSKDSDLNFLESLMPLVDPQKYTLFDLRPLKRAIFSNQLSIDNVGLRRTILGYDALLIIPQVSPSK
jgi:hypothetical protein